MLPALVLLVLVVLCLWPTVVACGAHGTAAQRATFAGALYALSPDLAYDAAPPRAEGPARPAPSPADLAELLYAEALPALLDGWASLETPPVAGPAPEAGPGRKPRRRLDYSGQGRTLPTPERRARRTS